MTFLERMAREKAIDHALLTQLKDLLSDESMAHAVVSWKHNLHGILTAWHEQQRALREDDTPPPRPEEPL